MRHPGRRTPYRDAPHLGRARSRPRSNRISFARWLDTYLNEKGIDPERVLITVSARGPNAIQIASLVDTMKRAPSPEQLAIRSLMAKMDVHDAPAIDYFRLLARAIACRSKLEFMAAFSQSMAA